MVWVCLILRIFYLQTKHSNCRTYCELTIQHELIAHHCLSAVRKYCFHRNDYLFKLFGRMDLAKRAFYHYFLLSNIEPAIQNHTQTSADSLLLDCSLFPTTNFMKTRHLLRLYITYY